MPVMKIMRKKYCRAWQAHRWQYGACWYLRLQIHTLTVCNTHYFATATVVTRTRLNITLYINARLVNYMPATCSCLRQWKIQTYGLSVLRMSIVILIGSTSSQPSAIVISGWLLLYLFHFVLLDFVHKHHCSLLCSTRETVLTGSG